jgi:hypothetical protein
MFSFGPKLITIWLEAYMITVQPAFVHTIRIAQRIETSNLSDQQNPFTILQLARANTGNQLTPMDINFESIQAVERVLRTKDVRGRPRCFFIVITVVM